MNEYKQTDRAGTVRYYKDKKMTILHREGGPAVEYSNGYKEWRINGKFHREDGPAAEYADGFREWYVDGKFIFDINRNGEMEHRMR